MANVIAKGLREQAYAVDIAEDGDAGLYQASINDYDLIVLDVLIPHRDGFEVCRELRARGDATPVLMLTKMALLKNKVVRAGEVIAVLESRDLQAQRAEAVAALNEARANERSLVTGTIPKTNAEDQKALMDARAKVNTTRATYERRRRLFEQGGISQKDLEASQLELTTAEDELRLQQQTIALRGQSLNPNDRALAAARTAQAQQHLATLDAQLSYATIRSPITGIVIDQFQYQGEFAVAGGKLITVADTSTVIVKAPFADTVAAQLKVGDAVSVLPTDASAEEMKGQITLLSRSSDPASRAVEVWVTLANGAGLLRANGAAQATVFANSKNDAIIVPASAVTLEASNADEGTVMVVALAETDRVLRHVEEMLMKTPEIEGYSRRTGLEMGLFVTEPNTGDFAVKLKPGHKRATEEVISDLRQQIAESEPALEVEFVGIVPDVIGDLQGNPEPIEIKLFSEDVAALESKADEVEIAIKKIPGVVDTNNGVIVSGPAITFRVDPQRASRFGVTADDIVKTAAAAMTGDEASFILQQDRLIRVRVIFPSDVRTSLDKVKALQVRSGSGQLFRIDQVADVEYEKGQTEIGRENLRQTVAVTGRLEGKDLGTAISEIRSQLNKEVKLPPGMTIEYGGLYQEQQSSFRELLLSLVLAVLLVFITLLIEFRSFAHPIAIVTGAVLALAGVLLALFITGMTLNVVSLMGMIMIVGIVAKNGILMLDAVEDHLAAGDTLRDALLRSGPRRFRPVLMTSLAAMLGMLPLALAFGAGSELLQPLAIAVIGGLTMALLLSLIVTPTVYAMLRSEPQRVVQTSDV
jgi:DNA-binding response OmpR family regulator